jgi:uncharacterized protein
MERTYVSELLKRMQEQRKFIQVVAGPRQVGKTTIIQQVLQKTPYPCINESADGVIQIGNVWIEQLWNTARLKIKTGAGCVIIAIDEIQKITDWSETVKKLWDEDTRSHTNIKVLLSGSSRLLIEKGLTESLTGRFELIYIPHWSFNEMKEAFNFSLPQYIYFGGYPGPAELITDERRWKTYIRDSIIETSVSKDILMLTTVTKPALLRLLFDLGSYYSAQILSYTKMLGQLTGAGNTVTLAHYLQLLDQCGLLCGLEKYTGSMVHTRSSSPKFQVYNNALLAATQNISFDECRKNQELWGRFVESACGTHLVDVQQSGNYTTGYWRERNDEIDYVIYNGKNAAAIEIKSGYRMQNSGTGAFKKQYPAAKTYIVSAQEDPSGSTLPLAEFLQLQPEQML